MFPRYPATTVLVSLPTVWHCFLLPSPTIIMVYLQHLPQPTHYQHFHSNAIAPVTGNGAAPTTHIPLRCWLAVVHCAQTPALWRIA